MGNTYTILLLDPDAAQKLLILVPYNVNNYFKQHRSADWTTRRIHRDVVLISASNNHLPYPKRPICT